MDLLKTILIYMSMVFVSSVQNAPEPTLAPLIPTSTPPALVTAATPAPSPTVKSTPVPTPDITPNNAYKTMKVGDSGEAVTTMQRRLAELGYYAGDIDGRFGNQTRRAVEHFQYYNGLSSDGIAGKKTLTVLYESKDVKSAPVSEGSETPTPPPSPSPDVRTIQPTASQTLQPDQASPLPTFFVSTQTPAAINAALETTQSVEPQASTTPKPAPTVMAMDGYGFVLAGQTDLLMEEAEEGAEPKPLIPLQMDEETVLIPLLDILGNVGAGVLVVPSASDEHVEYAFALLNDLYLLSYDLDEDGNPQGLVITKNGEPQVMVPRIAFIEDGRLYLPLAEMEKWTGMTCTLDEENQVYTVTLPERNG